MSLKSARQYCVWSFIVVVGLVSSLAAKPKPIPKPKPQSKPASGEYVVDIVKLKSGRTLRGGITWREPNGLLTMAVAYKWFHKSDPERATNVLAENIKGCESAWSQTRSRITELLKSENEDPRLVFFLKQELERLDQLLANQKIDSPDFVWIDVAQPTIANLRTTSPDQRQIALFAWDEQLADVEMRDAGSLKKELTGKGIKFDAPAPDLSGRLLARPQDDREWSVRMALVEYAISKPLDFQGIGDTLIHTEEGRPPNFAEILPKLLQQQVGSLLKDLASDGRPPANPQRGDEWLKPVIRQAEASKRRGFRVTRLNFDTNFLRVTVESRFLAQTPDGTWQTLWQSSITEEGTIARPEMQNRIEQDPQLKTALESMKSIGLLDPNALQQALRVGAATMTAQQNIDAQFGDFRGRYTRRLDGPPLWMTAAQ